MNITIISNLHRHSVVPTVMMAFPQLLQQSVTSRHATGSAVTPLYPTLHKPSFLSSEIRGGQCHVPLKQQKPTDNRGTDNNRGIKTRDE